MIFDSDLIIQSARECIGTPFVHQGRVSGRALDCAGLLVHVFKSVGAPYDDNVGYPRNPYRGLIKSILDAQPSLISEKSRSLFDGAILLMRIRKEPQHIAIWTGKTIIHSYSGAGKVVEHCLDDAWRRRIVKVYRIVKR